MANQFKCDVCCQVFSTAEALATHKQVVHSELRGEEVTDDRDYLLFEMKMGGMEGRGEIYFASKEEKSAGGNKSKWAEFCKTIGTALLATAEKWEGEEGQ